MKNILTLFCTICLLGVNMASAQNIKTPAASTTQTLTQDFALSQIKLSYSRPNAKGRKIYGDLVPYGNVWRTGANSPTKITFGEDVSFEGQAVPAGEYALYTIPGKTEWTIILSKNTKLWGAFGYNDADDLLRVKVKPLNLAKKVETFTIEMASVLPASCELILNWEKTSVPIKITANIDGKIMAAIDSAMKGEKKPYQQAAAYYFDNGKDLNKALEWANEAVNANPKAYWVEYLKAKIQFKLGKKTEAIASAKHSMEEAEKQNNPDYVALNRKLISEASK
ncbi:MAG: DUF2911 domain-containing protein [Sphingobacteriaceae bacterium]